MPVQFGRSSPFAAWIGLWGFANLWTTATREVGRLVTGAASAHLVYDHGVMKDRFHFEVEAGFQYVGWWGKWYKEGFRTDSAGDPMGGGRLLISVPVFGNPKTRFLMGAGYYRGARGAQDVQWLLTFRDFFW